MIPLVCKLLGHHWFRRMFGFERECLRCGAMQVRETHREPFTDPRRDAP